MYIYWSNSKTQTWELNREFSNQDNFEISSYSSRNGKSQQNNLQQMLEGLWGKRKAPLFSVDGILNRCSHYGNQCGKFSKSSNKATIFSNYITRWYMPTQRTKRSTLQILGQLCFLLFSSEQLENGNILIILQLISGY